MSRIPPDAALLVPIRASPVTRKDFPGVVVKAMMDEVPPLLVMTVRSLPAVLAPPVVAEIAPAP